MERYTGTLEDFVRAGLLEESAARNAAKCLATNSICGQPGKRFWTFFI